MNRIRKAFRLSVLSIGLLAAGAVTAAAQQSPPSEMSDAQTSTLQQHLDLLSSKIDSLRQQLEQSQSEMEAMRQEIASLRSQLAGTTQTQTAAQAAADLRAGVEQLQERTGVLESEVRQHDQTKVESLSKYPVRIFGTLLFTSVSNSGDTDDIDLPIVALPAQPDVPVGSFSATARQSLLGIDASGPRLWGAKSSAVISVDFFGGIPYADYTTSAGTVRLRTAQATLDWPNRSLAAVFDQPIISPQNPTSWLSVGEPALAWSGNLWTWSPQLVFREDSILPGRQLSAAFAIIDPPSPGSSSSGGQRSPDAAERSRQPGYEARLGDAISWRGRPVDLGVGGYYSRHDYSYDENVDAWAGTADWKIPLANSVEFSGELYRGRAIGGLGGGAFKDYASYDYYTSLRGLDAEGGWGQLKFTFSSTLEANLAVGQDNAFNNELRRSDLASDQDAYGSLARNQTAYGNLVYRPRSYLLISPEFRLIRSWPISGAVNSNKIFGLAAGYLF